MGRGGIYFRQTLPSSKKPESRRTPLGVPEERSSSIEFHDIESGSVSQMVDSSSTELLEEINSKSYETTYLAMGFGIEYLRACCSCCGKLADLDLLCNPPTLCWRLGLGDSR